VGEEGFETDAILVELEHVDMSWSLRNRSSNSAASQKLDPTALAMDWSRSYKG
jgi:hypothetical protein